ASGSLDLNEHNNLAAPLFGEPFIIDRAWTQVDVIELDPALRKLVGD
ncbi:amino acid ABC transporter substrate-binding protein, partial [Mycobacterium tuberculosis]